MNDDTISNLDYYHTLSRLCLSLFRLATVDTPSEQKTEKKKKPSIGRFLAPFHM